MSFLAGLYLAGAAAVTFPLLFHLIRRTPRGRLPFSSLMFLSPSPPRLTRRSRLDHLLLLLLRALAILLLAFAFMRPFFRQSSDASLQNVRGRRIAILLDISASMRRADLWQQALDKVKSQLDDLEPADNVALFTFADQVTTVVAFNEDSRLELEQQRELIHDSLTRLEPTWAETDLSLALVTVAETMDVLRDRANSLAVPQILLISDMQEGARLTMLDGYPWPKDINVKVEYVAPQREVTNASLRLLVDSESGTALSSDAKGQGPDRHRERFVRVRVENAAESESDQFYVRWANSGGKTRDGAVAFHVPAGQNRVLRVPHTEDDLDADRLVLSGDDCPFDDEFFVVPFRQERVRIVYVGDDDSANPDGLHFYLPIALPETRRRRVEIDVASQTDQLALGDTGVPQLVVVTKSLSATQQHQVDAYVRQGGTALVVLRDDEMSQSFGTLLRGITVAEPSPPNDQPYVLLGEIDFEHPLFAPFAGSGYGDFTSIHFWKHRRVTIAAGSSVRVLAHFDDGSPAVMEQQHGQGRLVLLASGWQPEDSQLARSWKFAVLLSELLELAGGPGWQSPDFVVGQSVTLPLKNVPADGQLVVDKPDGTKVKLRAGDLVFREANMPGIYGTTWSGTKHEFAVNLAASESKTTPLDADRLESLGIRLGQHATQAEETDRLRQLRDIELEGQQQVWRWLIVVALVLLILETWLAGTYARAPVAAAEA